MEDYKYRTNKERVDNEILFSKTIKAGKRIYYIDVKRDRKGELYISMTESKRLKEQADPMHPIFEKHKIFLYREDLEKFQHAFNEVANFTQGRSRTSFSSDWNKPTDNLDTEDFGKEEYKLNVEFE